MKIDYLKLYTKVYKNERLCRTLSVVSTVAVASSVAAVVLSLSLLLVGEGIASAIRLAAILFIPFLLVSLVRRAVNFSRPVEVFDLDGLGINTEGFKRGCSFPSRHVFSGFLIGSALLPTVPTLGALVLLLSSALGVARVLLGIHFLRDVVAGALLGILSALLGLVIIGL